MLALHHPERGWCGGRPTVGRRGLLARAAPEATSRKQAARGGDDAPSGRCRGVNRVPRGLGLRRWRGSARLELFELLVYPLVAALEPAELVQAAQVELAELERVARQVLGNVKVVISIGVSLVIFGNSVSLWSAAGCVITLAGVAAYNGAPKA